MNNGQSEKILTIGVNEPIDTIGWPDHAPTTSRTEGVTSIADALNILETESFDLIILSEELLSDNLCQQLVSFSGSTSSILVLQPARNELVYSLIGNQSGYTKKPLGSASLNEAKLQQNLPDSADSYPPLIGNSPAMRRVLAQVRQVSQYTTTVLITGESGTGKELIAREIHYLSPRSRGPFVAINCGAIPESLIESELFGHVKGAFTDALRDKMGLLEQASGGTIFLDEIGELPITLQAKLLRALQEQTVRSVGANANITLDVRIVAATLRDLEADVASGRFRGDLFYRLNVVPIHLPPLRDRPEDIRLLVDHFLSKYRQKHNLPVKAISPKALELLLRYTWPGNVRELENCIERAVVFCQGTSLLPEDLPPLIKEDIEFSAKLDSESEELASEECLSIKKRVRDLERHLITKALLKTGGNRTQAAKILELSHRALLYKLRDYQIMEDSGS